jgi:hypothetical protein
MMTSRFSGHISSRFALEHGDEVEPEFLTDGEICRRERENLFVVAEDGRAWWTFEG